LYLLRARCTSKLKKKYTPSGFILVPRLPLSATGKRDRSRLPDPELCPTIDDIFQREKTDILLRDHGSIGSFVASTIVDVLNLQPSQVVALTVSATFDMLGGDSLAAARITRALFAHHHQVDNTRHLGGEFGKLDGPFDAVHLIQAPSLGDYVDFLDSHRVGASESSLLSEQEKPRESGTSDLQDKEKAQRQNLYDALMQSCTLGHENIALALLEVGADPNYGNHGFRLGKTSGRLEQQSLFRSSPIHLATQKGQVRVVKALLHLGAKFNSPDASGLYPLHLAAVGSPKSNSELEGSESSQNHLRCVELLLEAGAPSRMRDANKQTVLHAAARSGNIAVAEYVLSTVPNPHALDCYDHWIRTSFTFVDLKTFLPVSHNASVVHRHSSPLGHLEWPCAHAFIVAGKWLQGLSSSSQVQSPIKCSN